MAEILPFDRRPTETEPAYAAFKLYLQLGHGRSMRDVARKLDKNHALMSRWSKRHFWPERALSYDAHIESISRDAEEKTLRATADTWATRYLESRERSYLVAQGLRKKAEAMLAFPLQEQTASKDGKTIIIKPCKWSVADAARMMEVAMKLERLSVGLSTEKTEHTGPEGAPIPVQTPQVVFYIPDNGRNKKP